MIAAMTEAATAFILDAIMSFTQQTTTHTHIQKASIRHRKENQYQHKMDEE